MVYYHYIKIIKFGFEFLNSIQLHDIYVYAILDCLRNYMISKTRKIGIFCVIYRGKMFDFKRKEKKNVNFQAWKEEKKKNI